VKLKNKIFKNWLNICFAFAFLSCSKDPPTFHLVNLNDNKISCFGHAGMGFYSIYPFNTWVSFESCLKRGADGTEMDIQITKDSVMVIMHDSFLQESTFCSGIISDLNWEEIKTCKIKSTVFKNEKLMSFDEFIAKVPDPKAYTYTWDCKLNTFGDDTYYKMYARTLVNTMNKYDLGSNVFIENPFDDFLQHIKDLKSDAKLFILAGDYEEGLNKVKQHDFYGLSMNNRDITGTDVKNAHDNGVRVTIYGLRWESENYTAVEKCPDFIQTDDMNYLLKIFGKYNSGNGLLYSVTK
jgi:glycerophosphoryl diester phosphodiesterase